MTGAPIKEGIMRLYSRILGMIIFLLGASSTLLYPADLGDLLKGLPNGGVHFALAQAAAGVSGTVAQPAAIVLRSSGRTSSG